MVVNDESVEKIVIKIANDGNTICLDLLILFMVTLFDVPLKLNCDGW